MIPGQHEIWEGSPNRHAGALRDTILIMLPGARLLPVVIHRAPLDGTVVETVLNHGNGGLNIDACRITASGPSPSIERRKNGIRTSSRSAAAAQADGCIEYRGSLEVYMQDHPGEHLGRWPTNVLLVHGPGCKCVGEVEAWNCQSDCPVRLLDEMSSIGPGSIGALRDPNGNLGYHGGVARGRGAVKAGVPDFGSASRFFPQFESLDEAMVWISRLIGKPSDATLATRRSTVP